MGGVFRVIPSAILSAEALNLSPHILQLCSAHQGPGAGHRADRVGQVDDAVRAGRLHQPAPARAHHHDRRPDRVRAPEQVVPDQPARGAHAHRLVQGGAARRAARGSGHRAGRRAARPGDDRHRHRDGGDRPPGVRHAAHDDGRVDGRPRHRSVPGRPPGADPRDAVRVAAAASSRRRCAARSAAAASPRSRCCWSTPRSRT